MQRRKRNHHPFHSVVLRTIHRRNMLGVFMFERVSDFNSVTICICERFIWKTLIGGEVCVVDDHDWDFDFHELSDGELRILMGIR